MKTLFIFRDCYDAKYILTKLNQKKLIESVILETGKDAKIRKLKNIFKQTNYLKYPLIILDITSLLIYNFWLGKKVMGRLGEQNYPKEKIKLLVDDVNKKEVITFIQNYKPELIFIYGTAILSKQLIKKAKAPILNIHGGLLPYYRNVHGDFWAYVNKDYKNTGASLFFLDPGIDTGDIALQKNINHTSKDSLSRIKIKILKVIPDLISEAIKKHSGKSLRKIKQDHSKAIYYKTPKALDLLKLFKIS